MSKGSSLILGINCLVNNFQHLFTKIVASEKSKFDE